MSKVTFRVFSLDVWGNARDGYDVNEQHDTGTEITYRYKDTLSDAQIIRGLRRAGVIDTGIRSKSIEVNDEWPDFTIRDVRTPRIPVKGDSPAYGWGKPALILQNTDPNA